MGVFRSSADAVLAAVEGKKVCGEHNVVAHAKGLCPIEIEGWGVHEGSMLCLHGTDMYWGEPVNTASKLGQDLAKHGEILVMPEVKASLTQAFADGDDRWRNCYFEKRTLALPMANVDFRYYCVHTARV